MEITFGNLRSAYVPHERVQKTFITPTRTQQSFAAEVDINNILAKHAKSGLLEHVKEYGANYIDQPNAIEFHQAMNVVANANTMFENLPAEVRADFENNPAWFLSFLEDPENREELIKKGLIAADAIADSELLDTGTIPPEVPPEPAPAEAEPETAPV